MESIFGGTFELHAIVARRLQSPAGGDQAPPAPGSASREETFAGAKVLVHREHIGDMPAFGQRQTNGREVRLKYVDEVGSSQAFAQPEPAYGQDLPPS